MAGRFQPPPTYALPIEEDEFGNSHFSPIWLKWFLDLSAPLDAEGRVGGGDITIENTSLDTLYVNGVLAGDVSRCIVPTSLEMPTSGGGNIEILKNKNITGNQDIIDEDGTVLLMEGIFVAPDGGVRSIPDSPKPLFTKYEGATTPENGVAYVVWGAESQITRFPPIGMGYGFPGDAGLFIVEWREAENTFVVVHAGAGADREWDQQESDYLFFIIQKESDSGGMDDVCLNPTWLANPLDTAGGSWASIPASKVWWSNASGNFPAGNPTQDLVTTFYDFFGNSVGVRTLRGTLTTATGIITVTEVSDTGITTSYALSADGTDAVLATITATLDTGKIMKAQVSWTAMDILGMNAQSILMSQIFGP